MDTGIDLVEVFADAACFQVYNEHCVVHDCADTSTGGNAGGTGNLYLIPGQAQVHTFSFYAQPEDIGKVLEVRLNTGLRKK